jgi:diguanylate cyclase (GGDEF)-like protein
MMKHSLFNRVILSLLLMLVITMGTGGFLLVRNLIVKTTHTYLNDGHEKVKLIAHSLTQWISEQKSLALALAADEDIRQLLEQPGDMPLYDRVHQRLQAFYDKTGHFENIALIIRRPESQQLQLDRNGRQIAIGNGTIYMDTVKGRTLGKASIKRDFVYHSMILGKTYISVPYPSILRGNPIFVISTPVYTEHKSISGIVATAPVLERFSKKFTEGTRLGQRGYILMCDQNGNIISHPDQARLLKENLFDTLGERLQASEGTVERSEDGEHIWYTYIRDPETGWYVVGKIYGSDIYATFEHEIMLLVIGLMIVGALLSAGGWWLIRKEVIQPLERIRLALRRFSPTIPITGEDLEPRTTTVEFRQINDSIVSMSAMFHNYLSVQRKMEAEIRHHAMYDQLTELPNRRYLYTHIADELTRAARENGRFALFFLDLDHFKLINDSLGHDVGDQLLQETAKRLGSLLSPEDLLARLGGDEFIIVVSGLGGSRNFEALAAKIVRVMHDKLVITNTQTHEFIISTSVGISIYPDHGTDVKTLMKHADIALYEAKEEGRNAYRFFDDGMNELIRNQLYLEQDMRKALREEQYTLFYQPQIDATSGRVVGAEALIRWMHPELGIISPVRFIHLAENTGFIYELGDWILEEACKVLSRWQYEYPDFKLSINISARQFQERGFIDKVRRTLKQYRIIPGNLVFEITETLIMAQKEHSMDVLQSVKEMGITIAMDDFGTGYSSLAYLKNFPIDVIKIDKAFIQGVFENADDFNIVKAIITLGCELDLEVVAEGVESLSQLEFLRASHCTIIQGYFFSTPLCETDFIAYIDRQNRQADAAEPAASDSSDQN